MAVGLSQLRIPIDYTENTKDTKGQIIVRAHLQGSHCVAEARLPLGHVRNLHMILYVYVCMCTYIYLYTYLCMYIYICTAVSMHMCMCIYI